MSKSRNSLPFRCEKCDQPFMSTDAGEILDHTIRVEIEGFVTRWQIEGREHVRFTNSPPMPTTYVTDLGLSPKKIEVVCSSCGERYKMNPKVIEMSWLTPNKDS